MNWKAAASSSEPRRTRGYTPPVNEDERHFVRRIEDMAWAAAGGGVRYTRFLSDREQALAAAALARAGVPYGLWGGYDGAERMVLCIGEAAAETAAEVCCLQITPSPVNAPLEHRDYLGALMGLGVERACIGDIVPQQSGGVCAFMVPAAARLAADELREVGRFCVRAVLGEGPEGAVALPQRQMRTASVASLRLDAVLAAMMQVSRTQAVQCIRSGAVAINHMPVQSAHADVFENDVFSVRGYGKYKLCTVGGKSRKGRTIVSYFQY